MSPVFRHGRLRLYLLKLLDEAPRHGYEVIRLLQDRFLGVYAPSPGTIYPRLARLEEEGLVTHDEENGRKVYRITDKGREELRARYDDLAELEEEITASVRDIAEEVSEDVRATVRSLREELTSAARQMRGQGRPRRPQRPPRPGEAWGEASAEDAREQADRVRREARAEHDRAREQARAERERAREQARTERERAREQARADRDEARAQRERARRGGQAGGRAPGGEGPGEEGWEEAWEEGWEQGWGGHGWGTWPDWAGRRGYPGNAWGDPQAYRDMERLARQFTREFRRAAEQAHAVGEEAVASLTDILGDALERIRTEVFGEPGRTGPPRNDRPQDTGPPGNDRPQDTGPPGNDRPQDTGEKPDPPSS